MNYRVGGWLVAMLIAMVLGPGLAYAFEAYMPALIDQGGIRPVTVGHMALAVRIITALPMGLVSACWVGSAARRERRNVLLWALFALITELVGVAVFFGIVAYQRTLDAKKNPGHELKKAEQIVRDNLG